MIKVGITGGIGSGKSTLCRLFAARGVAVYTSDDEAKRLMNEDPTLRQALIRHFGAECYTPEGLNRSYLAAAVFQNPEQLQLLNSLVHPAVRADFAAWCQRQQGPYVILESAILFESHFDREVDHTVAVLAPEALRLERTCSRDGVNREAVLHRMRAQMSDDELVTRADCSVVNIHPEDLEAAVAQLDKQFRHEAARLSHA